jgi:hydroxymethylbilane synthase
VPLGAYATKQDNEIRITGFVASVDGKQMVRETVIGEAHLAEQLGKTLADKLVSLGANAILAGLDGVK